MRASGGGPTLIECKVMRYFGHFEGDQQTYRAKGEVDELRATRDCLMTFSRRVTECGAIAEPATSTRSTRRSRALIDAAVAEAKAAAPTRRPRTSTTDVYVRY